MNNNVRKSKNKVLAFILSAFTLGSYPCQARKITSTTTSESSDSKVKKHLKEILCAGGTVVGVGTSAVLVGTMIILAQKINSSKKYKALKNDFEKITENPTIFKNFCSDILNYLRSNSNNKIKAFESKNDVKFETASIEDIEELIYKNIDEIFDLLPRNILESIVAKNTPTCNENQKIDKNLDDKKSDSEFLGLPNKSNVFCYMNSAIQLIYQIPEIENRLDEIIENSDVLQKPKLELLKQIITNLKNDVAIKDDSQIKDLVQKCGFNDNIQQDVCEAIECLGIINVEWLPFNCDNLTDIIKNNKTSQILSAGHFNQDNKIFCINRISEDGTTKITKDINFDENINLDGKNYTLRSIVCHLGGSPSSGHYYVYSKSKNGKWYECNDDRISCVGDDISSVPQIKNTATVFLYSTND